MAAHLREERRLRVFENRVLRMILIIIIIIIIITKDICLV